MATISACMSRVATARPKAQFAKTNKAAFSKAAAARTPARSASLKTKASASYQSSRPAETPEETAIRRAAESAKVNERAVAVRSLQELDALLIDAGDKLVMLSVESDEECDVGNMPDAWMVTGDKESNLTTHQERLPCIKLKSDLARVARDAPDVEFLTLDVNMGDRAAADMAAALGVTRFPTQQYYKNGELVWEHIGAGSEALASIGEGVLYYGGDGANGMRVSEHIQEVKSAAQYEDWKQQCAFPTEKANVPCDKQLSILDVSMLKSSPECMHVFPAVVALAKNTAGATRFARVQGDADADSAALMKSLNVDRVPTFIFHINGQEVDRYSGADRMQLVGKVIEYQQKCGVKVNSQKRQRTKMSSAEAQRIAAERRKEEARIRAQNIFGN